MKRVFYSCSLQIIALWMLIEFFFTNLFFCSQYYAAAAALFSVPNWFPLVAGRWDGWEKKYSKNFRIAFSECSNARKIIKFYANSLNLRFLSLFNILITFFLCSMFILLHTMLLLPRRKSCRYADARTETENYRNWRRMLLHNP